MGQGFHNSHSRLLGIFFIFLFKSFLGRFYSLFGDNCFRNLVLTARMKVAPLRNFHYWMSHTLHSSHGIVKKMSVLKNNPNGLCGSFETSSSQEYWQPFLRAKTGPSGSAFYDFIMRNTLTSRG